MPLPEQLQIAINRSGLSKQEIARRSGESVNNINNWLRGVEPGAISLSRVASIIGASVDDLLEMPPKVETTEPGRIIRTVAEALLASLELSERQKIAADRGKVLAQERPERPAAGQGKAGGRAKGAPTRLY